MAASDGTPTAPQAPGEFRRGSPALFAAAVGIATGASPIPFNSIGPLTKPLQAEFGWGRGQIMLAVLMFALAVTLLATWFGSLIDRHGVRRIALTSLALFGVSWAAITLTTANVYVFWLLWIACGVLGGASIPISWTRGVNAWFVSNRGLALALALAGTGVMAIVLPPLSAKLIAEYGWRGAVLGIALFPLAIGLPIAAWLFREPTPAERPAAVVGASGELEGMDLQSAMRQPRFWLMFTTFGLIALAFGGLFTNYVPLLSDKGFDPLTAGKIASAIGLSVLLGRLLAGYLVDRYWAPAVAFPMLALPAVACWLLTHDTLTAPVAVVAAVAVGFAAGAETDLIAFMAARYFGLRHYGKIYGLLYVPFGLGSAISAPAYGAVFDRFHSYTPALWVAAVLFVLGACLLLGVGRYPATHAASV